MSSFLQKLGKAAAKLEAAKTMPQQQAPAARKTKGKRGGSTRSPKKTKPSAARKKGAARSGKTKQQSIEMILESEKDIRKELDTVEQELQALEDQARTRAAAGDRTLKLQEQLLGTVDDIGKEIAHRLDPPTADALTEFRKMLSQQREEYNRFFSDRLSSLEFRMAEVANSVERIARDQNELLGSLRPQPLHPSERLLHMTSGKKDGKKDTMQSIDKQRQIALEKKIRHRVKDRDIDPAKRIKKAEALLKGSSISAKQKKRLQARITQLKKQMH
ncbi:hypothetical protein AUJ68_03795 [Candidatus Woesearchaeota archaeon CG1_02_57_44]|nr:MAG: hypothetical protein AUJ68_03795 [Candidatus Woesearchaeota archaeon CG1_02_57_44]